MRGGVGIATLGNTANMEGKKYWTAVYRYVGKPGIWYNVVQYFLPPVFAVFSSVVVPGAFVIVSSTGSIVA